MLAHHHQQHSWGSPDCLARPRAGTLGIHPSFYPCYTRPLHSKRRLTSLPIGQTSYKYGSTIHLGPQTAWLVLDHAASSCPRRPVDGATARLSPLLLTKYAATCTCSMCLPTHGLARQDCLGRPFTSRGLVPPSSGHGLHAHAEPPLSRPVPCRALITSRSQYRSEQLGRLQPIGLRLTPFRHPRPGGYNLFYSPWWALELMSPSPLPTAVPTAVEHPRPCLPCLQAGPSNQS